MSNTAIDDDRATVPSATEALQSRRQSLKTIGKFAAVTAPAMLVLLDAGAAGAACPTTGNKVGWTVNGKNSVV
ncbi:MAG: hypothetical protein U1E49_05635 [Hyphomicrobiaceae bacterium]